MNYFYVGNGVHGKMGISSYVFQQLVDTTVSEELNGEEKDALTAKGGLRKAKNRIEIDSKGSKLRVYVEIYGYKLSDFKKACERLQQAVYEAVYQTTEVAPTVDVTLLGVLDRND
jgi:enhancing lycopene biosynthesis protein 2